MGFARRLQKRNWMDINFNALLHEAGGSQPGICSTTAPQLNSQIVANFVADSREAARA